MSANTESDVYLTVGSSVSVSKKGCSSPAVSFPSMLALYFRSPSAKESTKLLEEKERKRRGKREREMGHKQQTNTCVVNIHCLCYNGKCYGKCYVEFSI